MMRVLAQGIFTVYVYREIGAKHKLPHCHIVWGEEGAVVALPSLTRLAGGPLPKEALDLIAGNLEAIWGQWTALNR